MPGIIDFPGMYTILWRDLGLRKPPAALNLWISWFGIIDDVITEPLVGAPGCSLPTGRLILYKRYQRIRMDVNQLVEERLARFRRIGRFHDKSSQSLCDRKVGCIVGKLECQWRRCARHECCHSNMVRTTLHYDLALGIYRGYHGLINDGAPHQ